MKRQILANTLVGKGKMHQIITKEIFISNEISSTLGCWIINLQYDVERKQKDVFLNGQYDIQLWYAEDNNQSSKVYVETICFSEKIGLFLQKISSFDDEEFKVIVDKYPKCNSMELNNDNKKITLEIESLFYVNLFRKSLLNVETYDEYDEIESLDEEITMNVNPNYLTSTDKETNNN